MIVEKEIASLVEEFKIPYKDPHCPEDWKDWYHYILYDPKTNIRVLFNLCFNGKPSTGYITDTFFITVPKGYVDNELVGLDKEESFGYARNHKWLPDTLENTPLNFENKSLTFKISSNNVLHLNVKHEDLRIQLNFLGCPNCNPIYVPELAPYGKGFIGWGVIPSYTMSGELWIQNRRINITEDWYGYHDRNFGRFNWGNIGWTWFVARVLDNEGNIWTYVFHQSNNSNYTRVGAPILFIHKNSLLQKVFIGDTAKVKTTWTKTHNKPKILPGSMASAFADRSVKTPEKITLFAKDEMHSVFLEMHVTSFAELIVPDSESKEFTFMKEMSGNILLEQQMFNEETNSKKGFYYGELVH
jgi:hypothetical protein